MRFVNLVCSLVLLLFVAGCGDNLDPSGDDRRPVVQAGTTGSVVGQNVLEFSVSDTGGNTVTLSTALASRKAAVFYFTMWCPICDSHMSHMRSTTIPQFPTVGFFAVDYVSGSIADAGSAASQNGYAGGEFTILADIGNAMLKSYQGTMGTTVVIDSSGIVRMNEDYRDGSRLLSVLAALP